MCRPRKRQATPQKGRAVPTLANSVTTGGGKAMMAHQLKTMIGKIGNGNHVERRITHKRKRWKKHHRIRPQPKVGTKFWNPRTPKQQNTRLQGVLQRKFTTLLQLLVPTECSRATTTYEHATHIQCATPSKCQLSSPNSVTNPMNTSRTIQQWNVEHRGSPSAGLPPIVLAQTPPPSVQLALPSVQIPANVPLPSPTPTSSTVIPTIQQQNGGYQTTPSAAFLSSVLAHPALRRAPNIRDLKIEVWPSYSKRQTAVCS